MSMAVEESGTDTVGASATGEMLTVKVFCDDKAVEVPSLETAITPKVTTPWSSDGALR